ncbi:MAG: hypothetical protein RI953_2261 [Pseudomonadota bacterium]|jgi:protein-disulfide isomerase
MKNEVKLLLLGLVVVALAFFGFAKIYQNQQVAAEKTTQPGQPAEPANPENAERLVRADSPSLGPEKAAVTLVEFLDPECESCRAFFPTVKKILKDFEGKIRFVVRYMPFHSNSLVAASATEAAGQQGKYWEMQELLFAKQPEWSHQQEPQKELMFKYANEIGLNMEKFSADFSNILVIQKIERDKQDGIALGVSGTPTFFVNGKRLEDLSYEALKSLIEDALKGAM